MSHFALFGIALFMVGQIWQGFSNEKEMKKLLKRIEELERKKENYDVVLTTKT